MLRMVLLSLALLLALSLTGDGSTFDPEPITISNGDDGPILILSPRPSR